MISYKPRNNTQRYTYSRALKSVAVCVAAVDDEFDAAAVAAAAVEAAAAAEVVAEALALWLRSLRGAPETEAMSAEAKIARTAKRAIGTEE